VTHRKKENKSGKTFRPDDVSQNQESTKRENNLGKTLEKIEGDFLLHVTGITYTAAITELQRQ
jgi:hypothetical protein